MAPQQRSESGPSFNDFVRGVQALATRAVRTLDEVRPAIEQFTHRVDRGLAPFRDWMAEHGPQLVAAAAALKKLAAESHIENWKTLDEDQWVRALTLMCADDGVPLAWVPPSHVVEALVDAPDHAARDAVLLKREVEIEQQARQLLDAVTHSQLTDLRAATAASWDAWNAGLTLPAQSAAGVIVGDVLVRHGFENFGDFRKQWEKFRDTLVEEWRLTELRTTAVMCALSTSVQREDQGAFPGFNRHASLHRLDAQQHTRANALRALMLVTAAVRELQFDKADEWLRAPGFTVPRVSDPNPERLAAKGEALRKRVDDLTSPERE
jgi:hypothetical protein